VLHFAKHHTTYVCMLNFQRHCNSKLVVQEAELRCTPPVGYRPQKWGYVVPHTPGRAAHDCETWRWRWWWWRWAVLTTVLVGVSTDVPERAVNSNWNQTQQFGKHEQARWTKRYERLNIRKQRAWHRHVQIKILADATRTSPITNCWLYDTPSSFNV